MGRSRERRVPVGVGSPPGGEVRVLSQGALVNRPVRDRLRLA